MLNFFKKKEKKKRIEVKKEINPEKIFWDWFLANKSKIEKFIENTENGYDIYNKLSKQMKRYDKLLFPELTIIDEKYVLIITPDGIKDGVKPTKKLGESHPEIENWVVKKFRQPTDKTTLNLNGLEYPMSDIEIIPDLDLENEKVDILLFIRNMDKDTEKYQHLAFLYLDHILGEFNTITRVRYIDFKHLEEGEVINNSINLVELRNLIATELY